MHFVIEKDLSYLIDWKMESELVKPWKKEKLKLGFLIYLF